MQKHKEGRRLILYPLLNKDLAFSQQERDAFRLHGFLPVHEATLEEQCTRAYQQFKVKDSDLEKHIFLRSLQDTNEVLFYNLLINHIEEMLPIVYTPTVGAGCIQFSHIYRHPRGLFISYPLKDKMQNLFHHTCYDRVKVIVVTDGERILGLGDQGANGMGISIGKLSLYSACAGIHPAYTLPIMLDVGTNNQEHLHDPLYIGWHHERIRGQEYDDFVEQFVKTVMKRFPHVLLQWEDFAQQNANPILARYRNKLCTFNDDIQGTAAVAVGTLLAAVKITGTPLKDQRIVVFGGGSAGCGISSLVKGAMQEEGLSEQKALENFFIVDKQGLLSHDQTNLLNFQQPFARLRNTYATWKLTNPNCITLKDVIHNVKPTVLIGVSGVAEAFNEELIKEMARHVTRPIIFPLSNPTSHAEATPTQLLAWTNSKAIISTGSPFAPVSIGGKSRIIDQTNNSYIFPGLGLGLIASQSSSVTDKMFMLAAKTLASLSPSAKNKNASLLPMIKDIREVSIKIAQTIALEALSSGLSHFKDKKSLFKAVANNCWQPKYESLV